MLSGFFFKKNEKNQTLLKFFERFQERYRSRIHIREKMYGVFPIQDSATKLFFFVSY